MPEPLDDLRRRYHTHDWVPVTTGRSGAGVWRLDGGPGYHVRCWATPAGAAELAAEADRMVWLVPRGVSRLTGLCPFDRGLAVTVPAARRVARDGLVDLADLDPERRDWTVERLLARLEATRPDAEDLVVCHGDLCLPNVLLDPETLTVTGIIDTGRLGVADRHADLALVTRSLTSRGLNPQYGAVHADRFLARYGHADPARIAFYRLLDEFF